MHESKDKQQATNTEKKHWVAPLLVVLDNDLEDVASSTGGNIDGLLSPTS